MRRTLGIGAVLAPVIVFVSCYGSRPTLAPNAGGESSMDSSQMQTARITLAALRSIQRETGQTRDDRVVIDGKSLAISEAVKELASHPKPLICRSGLSVDVLTISTAPA